jgi:hypothetical protein
MNMYALLLEKVPSTALRARLIVQEGLQLGAANGFTVLLQGILFHFHPKMAASILAPSYNSILQEPGTMTKPLTQQ